MTKLNFEDSLQLALEIGDRAERGVFLVGDSEVRIRKLRAGLDPDPDIDNYTLVDWEQVALHVTECLLSAGAAARALTALETYRNFAFDAFDTSWVEKPYLHADGLYYTVQWSSEKVTAVPGQEAVGEAYEHLDSAAQAEPLLGLIESAVQRATVLTKALKRAGMWDGEVRRLLDPAWEDMRAAREAWDATGDIIMQAVYWRRWEREKEEEKQAVEAAG
jgi:hypothetical protein